MHPSPRLIAAAILLLALPTSVLAAGRVGSRSASLPAGPHPTAPTTAKSYGSLPLQFERNVGQTDKRVKFLARSGGSTLFLTGSEAVLCLSRSSDAPRRIGPRDPIAHQPTQRDKQKVSVLRMRAVGANPNAPMAALDELPGKVNYFIGPDRSKWRTNIPTYRKAAYRGLYKNIDLVYYGTDGRLEYDFIVRPGGDPSKIALAFTGAKSMRIAGDGSLVLSLPGGDIAWRKPAIYQLNADGRRRAIAGGYTVASGGTVRFAVAAHDASLPLVIDPVLSYSTYLGGSGLDAINDIAVDSSGDAYVVGRTQSGLPTAIGDDPTVFGGVNESAFVAKLNPSGTSLIYTTYFGGGINATGYGIAVDSSGDTYIAGVSGGGIPTTTGVVQPNPVGGLDGFVAKLDPAGSTLLYATYIGGTASDQAWRVAVDSSGSAYIAGETSSTDMPVTPGAFQTSNLGGGDIFVAKLSPDASAFAYLTYLGGHGTEAGGSIAVDSDGCAYVSGNTSQGPGGPNDFPVTPGAAQTAYRGGAAGFNFWGDAFLAKLNASGTALVYSTYLGGSQTEDGGSVAVDSEHCAYVAGATSSFDFPVTPGAVNISQYGLEHFEIFAAKLNPDGSYFDYVSRFGGSNGEETADLSVDSFGNAYVTGETESTDYPVTSDALQSAYAGGFFTRITPSGSAIDYSTYISGPDISDAFGVAVDGLGGAYVAGESDGGTVFPTTIGAFQTAYGGDEDGFITKFTFPPTVLTLAITSATATASTVTPGMFTIRLTGTGFTHESIINLGATALETSYVDATELMATVASSSILTGNPLSITITNTDPDGGTSAPAVLAIITPNPLPTITSLSPSSVPVGSSTSTVTVTGTGFIPTSIVGTADSSFARTVVNSTTIVATIPNNFTAALWQQAIEVTNPAPAGGTSAPATLNIVAPVITALSPSSALAGDPAFPLTITGSSFVPNSIVRIGGASLPVTYTDETALTVTVPASAIATAGQVSVTVTNPAANGAVTASSTLNVTPPATPPAITAISPSSAAAGGADFTLTITGSGFTASSTIDVSGTDLATTFVDTTTLTATVPAAAIATAGPLTVTVTNPAPGGGTSAPAALAVDNPAPTITSLSPASVTAGAASFTLTITGSGFTASSAIDVGGTDLATTFVDTTTLTATVPAAAIATAGPLTVTVTNPAPGGGTSAPAALAVDNPAPTITSLSPASVTAGAASFTLTITGSGFTASSAIDVGGTDLATTFVDATTLTATVPAAAIATAGPLTVTVTNPAPGGGTSAPAALAVDNPAPTITSLSPASVTAGAASFTLTITGSGFTAQSAVAVGGVTPAATFVDTSTLTVSVPSSSVDIASSLPVTVTTPLPGGGTSSAATLTVDNPAPVVSSISPSSAVAGSAAFTITVGGTGFVPTSSVSVDGTALTTTYVSPTSIAADVTVSLLAQDGVLPVVVTNVSPGGGESAAVSLTIGNPQPTISSVSPTSVVAGSGGFTVTVTGVGFIPASTIRVNGTPVTTSFTSTTSISAFVAASFSITAAPLAITVTNPAPLGGTSAPATIDVTVPILHTFAAGLAMVSLPAEYASEPLSGIFGYSSPSLALWDASAWQYTVDSNSPISPANIANGFWIRFPQTVTITEQGILLPPGADAQLALSPGWNLVGCPSPQPVAIGSLRLLDAQTVAHPFAAAVTGGLASGTLYTFQGGDTEYESVAQTGSLNPYEGYWLYVTQACKLLYPDVP